MKTPKVNPETWKNLYQAAVEFQATAPWELFEDSEIFGVKDPASGEIGYCCILGAAGEVFGLCLYRGSAGFEFHQRLQTGDLDPEVDDAWALQNALMAEFADRRDLEKEDLAVMKSLGFKPQKNGHSPPCPRFRDYAPGFAPWFISENEAKWLTFALQCAADVAESIVEDEALLEPENPGFILTYFPCETEGKELSWTRKWHMPEPYVEPGLPEVPLNELMLRKVQGLQLRRDSVWETDAFFMGGGVVLDRDRPYFSRMAMIAQKRTGFIFNFAVLPPDQSPYFALREVLLEAMEKHRVLPSELHVRDEMMWEALKPLTDKLGFKLRLRRVLPTILEAKEALREHAMGGFPVSPS